MWYNDIIVYHCSFCDRPLIGFFPWCLGFLFGLSLQFSTPPNTLFSCLVVLYYTCFPSSSNGHLSFPHHITITYQLDDLLANDLALPCKITPSSPTTSYFSSIYFFFVFCFVTLICLIACAIFILYLISF